MFQSNQLIYIQMPKTGSTHIVSLLSRFIEGDEIGRHNPATPEQLASARRFVSSIRNPWAWYLSLWSYGVQGRGALMRRVTSRHLLDATKLALRNPRRHAGTPLSEARRDIGSWQQLYASTEDVAVFREWLRRMCDPDNAHLLALNYARMQIPALCGYMTYRYLQLCCRNQKRLYEPGSISSFADLDRFDRDSCYIDDFIRQESLEDDLCGVLENVRPLTEKERGSVYASDRTKTSSRSHPLASYYDEASIELVRNRERLLIDKFNYAPPRAD